MARTQQAVFDAIKASITAEPLLVNVGTNLSKTSILGLFVWLVAGAIVVVETGFDAFKLEVQALGAAAQVGNLAWYRAKILAFQYGDNLTFINNIYQYATIDATKQIIKRCSIEETSDLQIGGVMRIKVAKLDGTNLVELTTPEKNALTSYINKVRFAGAHYQLFSNNGDILKVSFQVYYDPIIPLSTVKTNVEKAITDYVANLPFNGKLVISLLTDQIQLVEGVTDVVFVSAASKFSAGDAYESFTRFKVAGGGYFRISTTSTETLNDTIQYIAQ
ncbi:MAG: hypothetical protein JNL70_00245 [Saprospiraceae bacterium]|nr:hypothetical protein [Saprospiraceae bacterium]